MRGEPKHQASQLTVGDSREHHLQARTCDCFQHMRMACLLSIRASDMEYEGLIKFLLIIKTSMLKVYNDPADTHIEFQIFLSSHRRRQQQSSEVRKMCRNSWAPYSCSNRARWLFSRCIFQVVRSANYHSIVAVPINRPFFYPNSHLHQIVPPSVIITKGQRI